LKKASYKEAVVNLFKAFVGSGVIAMPYSFYLGGYLLSGFIFILIGLLINYSQIMLVRL
jgi:proton-coupled amino acid transporter